MYVCVRLRQYLIFPVNESEWISRFLLSCFPYPASPGFCCFATGGDSLESKVIFIQLSEWGSPPECATNKEFTAHEMTPTGHCRLARTQRQFPYSDPILLVTPRIL